MREQASSLYDVSPYFFSKILAELPFSLMEPVILSVITYWLIGLNTSESSKFFMFVFILMLTVLASGAYTFFIGSLITNREVLIILVPVLIIPLSLLSGWFVRLDGSVTILWPFQWLSVFKYCFNGLLRNELQDNPDVVVQGIKSIWNATSQQMMNIPVTIDSNTLLNQMEAKLEIWECLLGLAVLYVVFLLFALIGLKVNSRRV